MKETVLVIGDHQQTIAVVRSLARSGRRVVVGQHGRAYSSWSRHAADCWNHPDPERRAEFASALRRELAARDDVDCVFPVGEGELLALLDNPPPGVRIAMPAPEVVRACLDKPRSYRIAAGCGVPQVPTAVVASHAELLAQAEAIGLPLAVKCPDSTRLIDGAKAVRCDDAAGLAALRGAQYPLVVQRWFDGTRHNCQFVAHDGALTAYFEQVVLRTDGPHGSGFGVEGVSVGPMQGLRRHCETLARALRYDGAGCAQFLVADSGDCMFLELNPRLDATCELAVRCGVDLPRLALDRDARGPRRYRQQRSYHWLLGDLRQVSRDLKRGEMRRGELLRALRRLTMASWRADCRLTWEWSDPLPTLYLYGRAVVVGGRNTMHEVTSH